MSFSLNTNVNAMTSHSKPNSTYASLNDSINRLSSAFRTNQSVDNAAAFPDARRVQNPAAVVTISDEAKQKLAEYRQGTINNAAETQEAKRAYVKDGAVARETANFAQQQIRQLTGTATSSQAQGIQSLLRGE